MMHEMTLTMSGSGECDSSRAAERSAGEPFVRSRDRPRRIVGMELQAAVNEDDTSPQRRRYNTG